MCKGEKLSDPLSDPWLCWCRLCKRLEFIKFHIPTNRNYSRFLMNTFRIPRLFKPIARYSREVYNKVFQDPTGTRVYKQTVINKVGGLGWGTLCFLNAGLAENKGRSKWNWLLISLFTGPLSTAYIVITKPIILQPVSIDPSR
jgi:hypothetical protein